MGGGKSREFALLDQASRMLAEASSLDQIKTVRDTAEAARTFAKAAKLGLELQNKAAEIKLRAERKAGTVLMELKLHGGDRKSKERQVPLTLDALGVSKNQSKRWQLVASIPDTDFEQFVKAKKDFGEEITSSGMYCLARKLRRPLDSSSGKQEQPSKLTPLTSFGTSPVTSAGTNLIPHELIEELGNHRRLLADLLQPMYIGGDLSFKQSERRVVVQLLGQMEELLKELSKQMATDLR